MLHADPAASRVLARRRRPRPAAIRPAARTGVALRAARVTSGLGASTRPKRRRAHSRSRRRPGRARRPPRRGQPRRPAARHPGRRRRSRRRRGPRGRARRGSAPPSRQRAVEDVAEHGRADDRGRRVARGDGDEPGSHERQRIGARKRTRAAVRRLNHPEVPVEHERRQRPPREPGARPRAKRREQPCGGADRHPSARLARQLGPRTPHVGAAPERGREEAGHGGRREAALEQPLELGARPALAVGERYHPSHSTGRPW